MAEIAHQARTNPMVNAMLLQNLPKLFELSTAVFISQHLVPLMMHSFTSEFHEIQVEVVKQVTYLQFAYLLDYLLAYWFAYLLAACVLLACMPACVPACLVDGWLVGCRLGWFVASWSVASCFLTACLPACLPAACCLLAALLTCGRVPGDNCELHD